MKKSKPKILVALEDGCNELSVAAAGIDKSLSQAAEIKVRNVSSLVISEILAADVYFFGVYSSDSALWTELKRIFLGINLAGRKAGFFMKKPDIAKALKKAFEPAELTLYPDFVITDGKDVAAWAQSVLK